MSQGLFQRLFAAADGALGNARVRPQAAPAWGPEKPAIEPPATEASMAGEPADRAAARDRLARATAEHLTSPMRTQAAAPERLQPLRTAMPATQARRQAAEPAKPDTVAVPARGAPPLEPAPALLQALAVPDASTPLPKRHAPSSPAATAGEADTEAAIAPPLLQALRHVDAAAAPRHGPIGTARHALPSPITPAPTDAPTIVRVSIGRIEFVAATAPATRPRPAPRASPRVPLAEYLSGKAR